jgi:outer membrane protein
MTYITEFSINMKSLIILLSFTFIPKTIFAKSDPLTINGIIDIALNQSINSDMNRIQEELNDRQYKSIINSLKPTLSFDFSGPSYTHSISPITQPDGTIKYHDVNGLTVAPSLSFSMPVLLTGGTLSIQQNLNYYQTRNYGITNKNYSANIYGISFSQPLNFYKSYKWQKKVAITSLSVEQMGTVEQNVSIKQDVAKLFFNIISTKSQIDTYLFEKSSLQNLLIQYENLYKQQKVLQTDVQDIKIKILQLENNIESSKSDLSEAKMKLNAYLNGKININKYDMICPPILYFLIDDSLAFHLLKKKEDINEKAIKASHESSIAQAKGQKGITASINMGMGMNSTSDKISNIWRSKLSNQNISLTISIPILGEEEKDNQYKIERLKYKLDYENNGSL